MRWSASMSTSTLAHSLFALSTVVSWVNAFSFNTSTPTQCESWTITWDGGTEPFFLVLVPTITVDSGKISNISIPTGLASNEYTFDLAEPSGLEMIATMYDASGWGSGGTTGVLTVGSSSNTSCLDTDVLSDFYFSTNPSDNPSQCGDMSITWEDNATYPIGLYGLIPSGSAWSIPVPETSSSTAITWAVDIAEGTQFLLMMSDAGTYGTGGSSGLLTVQSSSDSSCINSTSPASGGSNATTTTTAARSSSSASGVGGSSSGGSKSGDDGSGRNSSSSTNVGAIVGGTIGGVALLVLVAVGGWYFLRRRRHRQAEKANLRPRPQDGGWSNDQGRGEKSNRASRASIAEALALLAGRRHTSVDEARVSTTVPDGTARSTAAEPEDTSTSFDVSGDVYEPRPYTYVAPAPQDSTNTTGVTAAPITRPTAAIRKGVVPTGTSKARDPSSPVTRSSGRQEEGARLLPGTEALASPSRATFIQHEDSGAVVELPPRYDQLRARNPDE